MEWFNNLTKPQKVILIFIAGVVAIVGLAANATSPVFAVSIAFFSSILLLVLFSPLLYLARKKESNINQSEKKSKTLRLLLFILAISVSALLLSTTMFFQQKSNTTNQSVSTNKITGRLTLAEYLTISNSSVDVAISRKPGDGIMSVEDWLKSNTRFEGTIRNTRNVKARNIKVRLDFYYDKEPKELFYSTYVTIPSVESNGANPFSVWIEGYPTDIKQYTFTHRIESADFY